jgi:RHS repeat-associated protein
MARTGSANPVYLIPDRQGTDELTVDSGSGAAVTRRQFLPFGQTRGITPSPWPDGDHGYVDGTTSAATGLENLGAREYDANTGRFLSLDPVFESTDPNQLGGYDYAGNDPITQSDPSGLDPIPNCPVGDVACRNCSYSGNCSAPGSDGGGATAPAGSVMMNPCNCDGGGPRAGKSGSNDDNNVALLPTGTPRAPAVKPQTPIAAPPESVPDQNINYENLGPSDMCGSMLAFLCLAYDLSPIPSVVDCAKNPGIGSCAWAAVVATPAGKVIEGVSDIARWLNAVKDADDAAKTIGAASHAADVPANAANGARLAESMARESITSAFETDGTLNPIIVASSEVVIPGSEINNKAVVAELTSHGGTMADWGKYKTPEIRYPGGSFQVHFYMNSVTKQIDYAYDYKIKFSGK